MIISHKHKFIFLKNGKTGGTSIEIMLRGICGARDVITPISYIRLTLPVSLQSYDMNLQNLWELTLIESPDS